jgi:2-methylcitrate dehydratase PrpD
MNGNDQIADFVKNITWNDLPDDVKSKSKTCLLDALGAIIAGKEAVVTQVGKKFAKRMWPGNNEASILLSGERTSAVGAAFVNACAANALDIDDDGAYTEGHPGAQLIPVTLALSEKFQVSGQESLTALVIGYEVAHRMGYCWHDDHDIYQACGSWGSAANAAIAARLMKLDVPTIKQALGIADYNAPNLPMMRDIDHPAMVKHGMGWGAMTGIMSAELAADGFTGVPSLMGVEKYADWISTIGHDYLMVDGVSFKRFASCLWGHPAIQATTKVMNAHQINVSEIESIRIDGFHEMKRLYSELPETEEQAQFNVKWPLAALMIDGEVGPEQMLKKRLKDPEVISLFQKIEIVESEQMNQLHTSTKYPCEASIYLKGKEQPLSSGIEFYCNGDPTEPFGDIWDAQEVKDKFSRFSKSIIDTATIETCLQTVDQLDTLETIEPLIHLLGGE